MRGHAVAEEVEVERQLCRIHALGACLLFEHLDAMLALSAGRDLGAAVDQVVALGQRLVFGVEHVVERANRRCVVGEKHEVVTVLLLDVRGDAALALGVHVGVSAGHLVALGLDDLFRLGQWNARERARGHLDVDAEELRDFLAVLLLDSREARDHELLVQVHDVFVRLDPAHLGIDRGELGRVARGERGISAERGADLEDAAEACSLSHLLEELGALREKRLALEVLDLEELGARLARRRHQLRGLNLDEAAVDPDLAQRVQERRLHAEDQVLLGAAQVEKAPVEAHVDVRVIGDRVLGQRLGDDRDLVDLNLNAAELDALVVLQFAGDGDEAAVGQLGDGQRAGHENVAARILGIGLAQHAAVHQLHGATLIAKHHELNELLVAHLLDPPRNGDGAVFAGGEIFDQHTFLHPSSLSARGGARRACRRKWERPRGQCRGHRRTASSR